MIWSYLTMLVCAIGLIGLHVRRRSRNVWTAILAAVLAAVAILTGFSIGIFIAPLAVIALVFAALMVPLVTQSSRVDR